MAESSAVRDIPATDQACFDGFVLAVLAYGEMLREFGCLRLNSEK